MKYSEYVELVDQEYPDLQLSLVTISPPEALKLVATHCFVHMDIHSPLANETRAQLISITNKGVTAFDTDSTTASTPTEKTRGGQSEFV